MKLIERIMASRLAARGSANETDKIAYTILTVLYGELETAAKRSGVEMTNIEDEVVVSQVRKIIKGNNEVIALSGEGKSVQKLSIENEVLSAYLPQLMSEDEIRTALSNALYSNVGEAMKYMSETFAGKFDKGTASKIARELL